MTQRLTFAACGAALIASTALLCGHRWLFLVAAVSAAVAWMWRGYNDTNEGEDIS